MHVLGKIKPDTSKPKKPSAPKITKPAMEPPAAADHDPSAQAGRVGDALDAFEADCNEANPMRALMIMFWKARHQNDAFTVDVTPADIKGLEDCIKYLEVQPQIRVFRPQGMPAHPGAPATESRSAIPPRPAGKPKDYVVIQMVDQNGDAFVPIENNEDDLKRGQEAKRIATVKSTAPALAAQLIADLQANQTSSSTVMEAAEALKLLAARA